MAAAPPFYDDLDATLAESFRLLSLGVIERRSAFHQPVIALSGADGRPRPRTVTLRAFDAADRTLRFHSDIRSDKLAEIAHDPRIGVHVYSAPDKVQIRIDGVARVHRDDAIADAAWDGSRVLSRRCYGISPAQGAALDAGGDYTLPEDSELGVAIGKVNFCAIIVQIERLEWLYLAHSGHRRALFDWQGGKMKAGWLAP